MSESDKALENLVSHSDSTIQV